MCGARGVRRAIDCYYFFFFLLPSLSLQASSLELKQEWVRSIRQVIQERRGHLRGALREPIPLPKTPNPTLGRQRSISRRSTHGHTVSEAMLDASHHVICPLSRVKPPSDLQASVLMVFYYGACIFCLVVFKSRTPGSLLMFLNRQFAAENDLFHLKLIIRKAFENTQFTVCSFSKHVYLIEVFSVSALRCKRHFQPHGVLHTHTPLMQRSLTVEQTETSPSASQGDERGCRQSGRRQQSTRHRLHRLPDVTKHSRQRQGNAQTPALGFFFVHRGVSSSLMTSLLATGVGGWVCVFLMRVCEGVSSVHRQMLS